jgi:putative transcriptional regulator
LGLETTGVSGEVRIHAGGPVESARGFVLHTADYASDGTLPAGNGLALTIAPEILRFLGKSEGPRLFLVAFGYAGWGPGQLERELERGSWIAATADEPLIFDAEYGTKWERAKARQLFRL